MEKKEQEVNKSLTESNMELDKLKQVSSQLLYKDALLYLSTISEQRYRGLQKNHCKYGCYCLVMIQR